jgi:tRNA threonylcarbamoyladenosine biosynthesis protein TsaB
MIVLGIDSATPKASVALVEGGALLAEERQQERDRNSLQTGKQPSNHAAVIVPLIERVLSRNCTTFEQLAGVSISIGPGSFTGLRIGLATAKGLAYESGVSLVGVSTLLANGRRAAHREAFVGSVLDARKGEVYCALFRSTAREFIRLTDDALTNIDDLIPYWQQHLSERRAPLLLIGDGAAVHEKRLVHCLDATAIVSEDSVCSIAAEVAKIGYADITQESSAKTFDSAPVYLRSSAAELKLKAP